MPEAPPPAFTRIEQVDEEVHGQRVADPYRWLEDGEALEVVEWTAGQVERARRYLDGLPERPAVEARLREALGAGSLGVLVPRGRWRFFTRREPGHDQAALFVIGVDGEPRLLVDPAPLSADAATALDWYHPSRDGELVAYGISEAGTEDSVLRVMETATGRDLGVAIPRCRLATVAFEPGNRAFLYTRLPLPGEVPEAEINYHRRLFRHRLEGEGADQMVFGRSMLEYPAAVSFNRDGRWSVLVCAEGWARTNVFLSREGGPYEPIFDGPEREVHAFFAGDRLLAVTNVDAPRHRLVEIDPQDPAPERWRTVVAESEHVLVDARATLSRLLVHHLVDARSRLSVHAADGVVEREVQLPGFATVTGLGASADLEDAYVAVEEFTRPAAVYRVDPASGDTQAVMHVEPPVGFEAERFPVRQEWFTSKDGTRVPMFVIGAPGGRPAPVALTGYGGFNISRTPVWSPELLPLLEAGGVHVVANLRGGGEYGEEWHRGGMRERKQTVFDDFVAAAEHLVATGITAPDRLAIHGRSNGGLLVGVAMTQRPDLFGAVWCGVPLLDMVRYEAFQVARLWAAEYGSAAVPEEFAWLRAYSPYHAVREGVRYPPVLLTTSDGDTRVDAMHARKMAARLQAVGAMALLRVEERAGHGQGKPVSKLVEEAADAWAFLIHQVTARG